MKEKIDRLKQLFKNPGEFIPEVSRIMNLPAERVRAVQPGKIFYKPGGNCKFRVQVLLEGPDGSLQEMGLSGKIYAQGYREAVSREGQYSDFSAPPVGVPVGFWPELWAILWADPNDPDLPARRIFEDARLFAEFMEQEESVRAVFSNGAAADFRVQRLKYVPGDRAAYLIQHPTTGEKLFVKLSATGDAERVAFYYRQLSSCLAIQRNGVSVPRFRFYHPGTRSLWLEALEGTPLADIWHRVDLAALATRIGEQLAHFQKCRMAAPLRWTVGTMTARLEELQQRLSKMSDDIRRSMDGLIEKLFEDSVLFRSDHPVLLHGSFKLSHVLWDEAAGEIRFIDLDGVCRGDAEYDVGRFLAHLLKLRAAGKMSREEFEAIRSRLTTSFAFNHSSLISSEKIHWYTAAEFLNSQMFKLIKRQKLKAFQDYLRVAKEFVYHPFSG